MFRAWTQGIRRCALLGQFTAEERMTEDFVNANHDIIVPLLRRVPERQTGKVNVVMDTG